MGRKKISTTIYITSEQDRQLKELSKRTKVPVSVYIREGIDSVLAYYKHVLPGQLQLIKDPPRDY
jgi:predicted DNA-binding protein